MGKTVGEALKDGRMRQRLAIAECAKRTHISPQYLEALEEERWADLPSESHRIGFLRLYARFLGVPAEELVQLYRKAQQIPVTEHHPEPARVAAPALPEKTVQRFSMVSWQRLCLLGIVALIVAWGVYHALGHFRSEPRVNLSWLRFRPHASRLVADKHGLPVQRIRVTAQADSWLRVVDNHELVFEGILPAGAVKEWSGPGPFLIKAGNVTAVAMYWNDQPVDLKSAAHGNVAELSLPPPPSEGGK